jgi:hypothetical protein
MLPDMPLHTDLPGQVKLTTSLYWSTQTVDRRTVITANIPAAIWLILFCLSPSYQKFLLD